MRVAFLVLLLVFLAVVLWVQWIWWLFPHLNLAEVVARAADIFWYRLWHD